MTGNIRNLLYFLILIVIMTLISLISYGFASAHQHAGKKLHSVPLPVYQKGTTFVYSDGSWETVVANSSDKVTWRDHRGYLSSGSADFTRRRTEWQSKTRQGTRQFEPRTDLWVRHKTSLWPLDIGNEASFAETGAWRKRDEPENSYRANWTCEVAGKERVSVMAGEFDTWKIVCERYSGKRISKISRIRETRTWHYAPVVGHYVMTTRRYFTGKPSKRLELLAVLPPLNGLSTSAKRQLQSKFQTALEFKKSGESLKWSLPKSALSGKIMPTGTFRLDKGQYARRYVQILNRPEGQQTYYGMAVRDARGRWIVPRR